MTMRAIDPDLVRRVAGGDYRVDPYAVAEAMLSRRARLDEWRRVSRMLVPGRFHAPSGGEED
jgi:hypothetical protein